MPVPSDPQLLELIARAADGELNAEQAAEFEQRLSENPQLRSWAQAELAGHPQLKRCVGRVMGRSIAPTAVHDQVRAVMAAATIANDVSPVLGQIRNGSVVSTSARQPIARRAPLRANALAIAATLALIAGAVLYGIFGRTIDEVAPPAGDLVSDAALYVDRQHGSSALVMASLVGPDGAEAYLHQLLGVPVTIFDLSSMGYEFVGAGPCDIPVPAKSAQLLYRKQNPDNGRSPLLSVFVIKDRGSCRGKLCEGAERGTWCCVTDRAKCKRKVIRGTDGQLVYFMTCCIGTDLENAAQHIQLASATPSRR